MGMKKWDLPPGQGGALIVLSIAFLLGGSVGCVLAAASNGEGAQELSEYLADYLTLTQEGELPRRLWPVIWGQMKYVLAVLVLTLTALGTVGMPLVFWVRGFSLCFPAACFCRIFGWRGLLPAFILFGLPALLWSPALFLLGTPGLLSAQRLLRRSLGESAPPLNPAIWYRAVACAGLGLSAGLLEYWVVPVLLRGVAQVVL